MDGVAKIPTIDLSVFFSDDEQGKSLAKETISRACADYGFFQVANHGIPHDVMSGCMELCKTFFGLPDEDKLKSRPRAGSPIPAGYGKQPKHSFDKNEYVMMLPPHNALNVLPNTPPGFREALEEMFTYLSRTGELMSNILNDCLGLPPNFLKEYNQDRGLDLMTAKRYFPATDTDNIGISRHQDSNILTFIFQDQVGGLEVLVKNGQWVPVVPSPDMLVVNIGDIIQVMTNNKFKSATHRVTRQQGKSRYSISYFRNLGGDKWVEPLTEFTTQIGEPPKYRGFVYKDYLALRIRNKTHPPSKPEDEVNITHFAISTD